MRNTISRAEVNRADRELCAMAPKKKSAFHNRPKGWQALRAFYHLKSLLAPDFIKRNVRTLNSLEAELMRQYDKELETNEQIYRKEGLLK